MSTQLDLFAEPRRASGILFDLDLGDHIARAVAHGLGRIWVYHAKPGPGPYSADLAWIDEVPGDLDADGVRSALATSLRVWPVTTLAGLQDMYKAGCTWEEIFQARGYGPDGAPA